MSGHDLSREAQPDAGAVGFGGVERHENLFLLAKWHRLSVIRHADYGAVFGIQFRADANRVRFGLHSILYQVVKHLYNLTFVDID